MTQYLNLSRECVELVEAFTPLPALVQKTDMGRYWEVPVDERTFRLLTNHRRPDENWSDVVMRLVREGQRLTDFRGSTVP